VDKVEYTELYDIFVANLMCCGWNGVPGIVWGRHRNCDSLPHIVSWLIENCVTGRTTDEVVIESILQ
jgi:hypothetical protein